MAKDTLSASPEGIKIINERLKCYKKTKKQLAIDVFCTRETIYSLLRGNRIKEDTLKDICDKLALNLKDVAKNEYELSNKLDVELLVNKFREQVKPYIENRCGEMRIFAMSQPIGLSDIYTQVNILKTISGRRSKNITELIQDCNVDDFRFSSRRVTEEKIPAKEAVTKNRKLLILGKPGAGKTTFLKHLAIQCNRGEFQGDLIPFFVTLKDFAEEESKPNLLTYLGKYVQEQYQNDLTHIFSKGKALILLDGLDEVLEADSQRVLKEIRDFSIQFFDNQYVMTCRIAAKEYTFEQFTEVEIADFDWKQTKIFATNWFKTKAIKSETFLARLEKDKLIKELTSNPLLLTLLCLAFEELGKFPVNRAKLYKEGLKALLKQWDKNRGIERNQVSQKLWKQRKEDLLSKIAWDTFSSGEYFFKQDKAERYISEYIRNLPGANVDEEALRLDSEAVLQSIESQHGLLVSVANNIYSFSHLSFQEYFTAREIVIVRQSSAEALQELVSHLFEPRWHEVFLLAVAMSPNADKLVLFMKEKIDDLVAKDEKIQQFLQWLDKKTKTVNISFKSKGIQSIKNKLDFYLITNLPCSRTLYFTLSFGFLPKPNIDFDRFFSQPLNIDFDLFRTFNFVKTCYISPSSNKSLMFFDNNVFLLLSLSNILNNSINRAKKNDSKLHQELQKLSKRLPNPENRKKNQQWKKSKSVEWTEDLRAIMIKYRNIGHDWQFSNEQKELLEKYYFANQLLTQCLHQECYVSREVRQGIEETLLLPIAEIEKRKGI